MLKKAVAYKKAIGHEPDHEQLKQILYVCIDMNSKNLASQSGFDRKPYVDTCEDIDRRYRLQFEGLDFARAAKGDDPTGLSYISENYKKPPAPAPPSGAREEHRAEGCLRRGVQRQGQGQERRQV